MITLVPESPPLMWISLVMLLVILGLILDQKEIPLRAIQSHLEFLFRVPRLVPVGFVAVAMKHSYEISILKPMIGFWHLIINLVQSPVRFVSISNIQVIVQSVGTCYATYLFND